MGNVLRGILELARRADHRNYIWRMQFGHHLFQFDHYYSQLKQLDLEPDLRIDHSIEACRLVRIDIAIEDGHTNLDFVLKKRGEPERIMPVREILTIEPVLPSSNIPAHMIN